MIFIDRIDAGKKLVPFLQRYKDQKDTIVLGLPRGGVVIAYEIAHALHLPLDIVVPRKIGAPMQPELAIGAVTQDGSVMLNEMVMDKFGITQVDIEPIIQKEMHEAKRRLKAYRGTKPPLDLHDKTVLLVDDGIATGYTMLAAIESVRARGAKKIVVVVPVAPPDTVNQLLRIVDDVVCLFQPEFFGAIGRFYEDFGQTTDEEVIELLKKIH